jgi:predicted phage terminase large subunit-like protein
MIPRLGKTTLVTKRFPVYWLERRPKDQVILAAYNRELAEEFNEAAFKLYASRNPVNREAVSHWTTVQGGGSLAAGVGSGVTGFGADLLICDDPIKGYEEANSPAYRKRAWQWWKTDFRTRRNDPNRTPTILIQTRWHLEDIAGKLLDEEAGDWTVLSLPGLTPDDADPADDPLGRGPGESICPERFPVDLLRRIQHELGPIDWSCLYAQNPLPEEGVMFDASKFTVVDYLPHDEIKWRVRYWDQAATAGAGDYTVGVLMAMSEHKRYYVVDVVRGQFAEDVVDTIMLDTAREDARRYGLFPLWFEREPAASGKKAATATLHLLKDFDAHADRPITNKIARARPWAKAIGRGDVYLLQGEWNAAFIAEHARFNPASKNPRDDQIDAASGAYAKLTTERLIVTIR